MAEFLKGDQLNFELVNIFEQATEQIIIISPFIKLHSRIKDALKEKLDKPKLKITIVFGKNEAKKSKSLNKEEFEFLSQFPNIEIKYEARLHAKYYANESIALLSSMNLYEYSQNNNIEFGILTTRNLLRSITNIGDTLDKDAFQYFETVIKNSEQKFLKEPIFEEKLMGLSKIYSHSVITEDKLSTEFSKIETVIKSNKPKDERGYCIRTGKRIPFNTKKPFSPKAFESWNEYKNEHYAEKYCHFSGEESNGKTSFAKPILHKNWKKAQSHKQKNI